MEIEKIKGSEKQNLKYKNYIKEILTYYSPHNSISLKLITDHLGFVPNYLELRTICYIFSKFYNLEFPREFYREKRMLIIWLDYHINKGIITIKDLKIEK